MKDALLSGAAGGVERVTIPDWGFGRGTYDMSDDQGLLIDFESLRPSTANGLEMGIYDICGR